MIFFITLISCFLILLLLIIWKRKLIKDLFQNRKDPKVSKLLGLSIPATLFALLFTIYGVPALLKNIIPFKTYEDYLFWNEYNVTGYAELEEGAVYSVDHNLETYLLDKHNGNIQLHKTKEAHKEITLENEGMIIFLNVLELIDMDKYIITSAHMTEDDFDLVIEGEQAVLFAKRSNWIEKINIMEKTDLLVVIFNEKEFVLELD